MRDDTNIGTDGRRGFLEKLAAGLFGARGAVRFGRADSTVSAWAGTETNSVLNQARQSRRDSSGSSRSSR